MNRQSLYFTAPFAVEVREEPLPAPQRGEVLVATRVSAISSGTELLFYRGQVPPGMAVDATLAGMDTAVTYPLKYGYACAGNVIACGPDVDPAWLQRPVFAFHPHESHFTAPVDALMPLPDGMDPETAVFLPNMETAVSFVMDAQPVVGEQVAVLGQGIVGLLTTALLAQFPLARLVTLDRYPQRRARSLALGADAAFDPAEADALARATATLQGQGSYAGADLTLELSGNPAALNDAIALTGFAGRIVVGSWYGTKQAALDLGGQFHRSQMQIVSSQVSHLAARWHGRFTKTRRLQTAWRLLEQLQPRQLVTHRIPFAQAADAYRMLDAQPAAIIQLLLVYA